MLTGLPPHEHGAIRNVERIRLRDVPSLPAFLRRRGWATGAFVSVPFLEPRAKRLPGFAHCEWPSVGEQWSARETFRRAAAWVRAHADEAFFVWLHAYDPHKPYAPSPPYDTLFWPGDPETWTPSRSGIVSDGAPTPRQAAYVNALYDGEIRATDAALEEFFATIHDVWKKPPLVVLAADHGEVLEEQVEDIQLVYFHGKYPYNQALSVPLIMHWPGHLAPARRWEPVDITAIAPTVARLLFDDGFETMAAPLPGVVPGGSEAPGPLFAFAPRAATASKVMAGWDFRAVETWSILDWPWHLVHNPRRGTFLYDVERDPHERHDRAANEAERVERLRAEAIAYFSRVPPDEGIQGPVDERLREQLESLGYVD
jgi:arylsulfatase A-like enzyme